jgi:predicted PurR-regulated permease PerM
VLALVLILLVPVLANQLAAFIDNLPSYVEELQGLFGSFLQSRFARYIGVDGESIRGSLSGIMSQGTAWLSTLLKSLWNGGRALLDIISLFVVTPVVAFYLLYDWDRMVARVDELLPRDHVDEIRELARQIDRAIAAFVRGQGLVCLILGAVYATGLAVVGLNFGVLIGICAGLISFIPYAGFTLGFVVSMGVALVQFLPEWQWVVAVVAVFMIGQFIEGYVLQPRLLGHSVGLHPVWLLFSLFAFGLLFGFVGLMIAIPAAAAVAVLVRFGLKRYMESPIYRGNPPPPLE